jgi:hypothetical protein
VQKLVEGIFSIIRSGDGISIQCPVSSRDHTLPSTIIQLMASHHTHTHYMHTKHALIFYVIQHEENASIIFEIAMKNLKEIRQR